MMDLNTCFWGIIPFYTTDMMETVFVFGSITGHPRASEEVITYFEAVLGGVKYLQGSHVSGIFWYFLVFSCIFYYFHSIFWYFLVTSLLIKSHSLRPGRCKTPWASSRGAGSPW